MLTRFSEILRRHDPLVRLVLRLALLAILVAMALDLHSVTTSISDLVDSVDLIQQDLSGLRESLEGGEDADTSGPNGPAI